MEALTVKERHRDEYEAHLLRRLATAKRPGRRQVLERQLRYVRRAKRRAERPQPCRAGKRCLPAKQWLEDVSVPSHLTLPWLVRGQLQPVRYMEADPCTWCNGPADTYDHVEPRRHHQALIDNCARACKACNHARGDQSALAWLAR